MGCNCEIRFQDTQCNRSVEEVKRGSYAAEISAQIAEELFDELDAPVERVCGLNIVSPFSPTLEDENFPHPADIVKAVKKVLNK